MVNIKKSFLSYITRIELTKNGLLAQLANHYITQEAHTKVCVAI